MDTPLLLDDYFFPHIKVSAAATVGESSDTNNSNFEIGTNVVKIKDEDGVELYQLALQIHSTPPSDEDKSLYSIELVVIGHFRVHPEFDNPTKLLEINGASILYSSAREFLITVTSRGPWGPVTLPTTSFLKMYKQAEEERKNGEDEGEGQREVE